jgi:formylglycine-generating enzyme required for sulfatase activity
MAYKVASVLFVAAMLFFAAPSVLKAESRTPPPPPPLADDEVSIDKFMNEIVVDPASDAEKEAAPAAAKETPPKGAAPKAVKSADAAKGMVLIPAGEFMIGCAADDNECYDYEKPPKRIKITKPFYMDKHPVTQEDYERVMNETPSFFKSCGANCPVETVPWFLAVSYCTRVNKRLPTEAEYEYAERGGSKTRYFWSDTIDGDYLWYADNSQVKYADAINGKGTHPVGQKKPNGFGLYDMAGNVWEWTSDCWRADRYKDIPESDPAEVSASCEGRVLRGGSWFLPARMQRASIRNGYYPNKGNYYVGFRCAKDTGEKK